MTYTEQCVPLIRHIHCAMEKEANNKLREMDLTVSQIYLLQALNHAPDGTHTLTLKALEKQLQIGQSTTVGLVKRLQKKDFVTCTQSIDDKRIKIVALTVAGKNICCNAEAHMHSTCVKLDCIREICGRNDENCLDRIDIIGYKTVQKQR